MKKVYLGVVRLDKKKDVYGIDFPDLPGCITGAGNIEELYNNAVEVLELHVEGMAEEGIKIPDPSDYKKINSEIAPDDEIIFLAPIPVKIPDMLAKRINVTMQDSVLNRIDNFVSVHGGNRSQFLADAALDYMKTH